MCSVVTSRAIARHPESLHYLRSCFLSIRNVPLTSGTWPILLHGWCFLQVQLYLWNAAKCSQRAVPKPKDEDEFISFSCAVYIKFSAPITLTSIYQQGVQRFRIIVPLTKHTSPGWFWFIFSDFLCFNVCLRLARFKLSLPRVHGNLFSA